MRLIDADAALENMNQGMNYVYDLTDLPDYLADCQTIDASPVVHARWAESLEDFGWYTVHNKNICTACNTSNSDRTNYCPNCGAKMDLEE